LSAIENAENRDGIAGDFKRYRDASAETEDAKAGRNIIARRAAQGEGFQAFALLNDRVGLARSDFHG
jgi:hypothetical protein